MVQWWKIFFFGKDFVIKMSSTHRHTVVSLGLSGSLNYENVIGDDLLVFIGIQNSRLPSPSPPGWICVCMYVSCSVSDLESPPLTTLYQPTWRNRTSKTGRGRKMSRHFACHVWSALKSNWEKSQKCQIPKVSRNLPLFPFFQSLWVETEALCCFVTDPCSPILSYLPWINRFCQ